MASYRSRHDLLGDVAAALVGLTMDGVTVLEASAGFDTWSGEERISVEVRLSDPAPGLRTWPVAVLRDIRMEVRRRVAETGLEEFVDVRTAAARDDDDTESALPPGPSTAHVPTSDQRSGPE